MEVYDRLWHSDVAPQARNRLLLTELLYLAPNERYDRLMKDLQEADGDTLREINNGNRLAVRKLLHFSDLPMLATFARNQLAK
jgi:digeranylgeranylglycerophospholipid reductase